MNNTVDIVENIRLLKIPFGCVYTSVFFIAEGKEITLYDAATTSDDVENYIFPCLEELEKDGFTLKRIVISHFHDDHAGGLCHAANRYPYAVIYAGDAPYFSKQGIDGVIQVNDNMQISDNLTLYRFYGHSHDCTAIYDRRTKAFLTADAFQGYGILKYGVYGDVGKWLESIEKAKAVDVETLIASHDYFPMGQTACGRSKVLQYLDGCSKCFYDIYDYIKKCNNQEITDLREIAAKYNGERKAIYQNHPTIGADFMEIVSRYFE